MFLGTNKIKNIIKKEYYFIIILFILSFVINQKINKETKLSLILCAIVICIYNPLLLIPFLIFLVSFFIGYKYVVVEKFENSISNNENSCISENLIEIIKNLEPEESITNIGTIIYNFDNYTSNLDFKDDINKIKFLKYLFNIYFFDEDNISTWNFIKEIGEKISYSKFESQLQMTDYKSIITSINPSKYLSPTFEDNIQGLDTIISKLLKNSYDDEELIYKCLGIHFHLNFDFKNKNLEMINKIGFKKIFNNNELKYQNLSDIINQTNTTQDTIDEQGCDYKKSVHLMNKIKKNINELVIIQYKLSIDNDLDIDYFKDREIVINPYLIFNNDYSKENIYYKKINFILKPEVINDNEENKFLFLPSNQQIVNVMNSGITNENFLNEYIKIFSEVIFQYLDSDSDIFKKQFNYLSLIFILIMMNL